MSHVISKTRFVSPDTRRTVENAIRDLEYQPGYLVRALNVGSMWVIGYDDLEFASYMLPALTTIYQPGFEFGLNAAEILIAHLKTK